METVTREEMRDVQTFRCHPGAVVLQCSKKGDSMGKFHLAKHKDLQTSSDLMFSAMFERQSLFEALVEAATGIRPQLTEKPLSQVAYQPPKFLSRNAEARRVNERLDTVRVDVQADGENGVFTADMQRRFSDKNIQNRSVFYACRAFSSQSVPGNRYEDLNPVHVTFIMSGKNRAHPIERLTLVNETTGERSGLLNMVNVFVPAVVEDPELGGKNHNLWVFSRFFAVKTQEQANQFETEFGDEPLGKELLMAYANAVRERTRLLGVRHNNPYFTEKDVVEAQAQAKKAWAQGKAEGMAEGEVKGRFEIARSALQMSMPIDDIVRLTSLTRQEIEALQSSPRQKSIDFAAVQIPDAKPKDARAVSREDTFDDL
jgi:hypothetical protein